LPMALQKKDFNLYPMMLKKAGNAGFFRF